MTRRWTHLAAALFASIALFDANAEAAKPTSGWGIDACLSGHIDFGEVPGYLRLLQTADLVWLRERTIGSSSAANLIGIINRNSAPATPQMRVWRLERLAGFRILAFASALRAVPVTQPGNQLPEDLLAVYHAHRETAAATAGLISAWEMVGEPETSYCRDLPDRVAAYQKAVYLALKAPYLSGPVGLTFQSPINMWMVRGAVTNASRFNAASLAPPAVLTGAFAFPPGPWLELAAQNGLYDYTDAINYHHYGFARDFSAAIQAHRAFAKPYARGRDLPVWVTEVGLNNAPYDDPDDARSRAAQADYLVACARQAIAQRVAVFMPFILVHRGDPFAVTETPQEVHPGWTAYRDFTLAHRLQPREFVAPPRAPLPVVLQWVPDNATCVPHKPSGAYWFQSNNVGALQPIQGELRVYNFSSQRASVAWRSTPEVEHLDPASTRAFTLEPFSARAFPVRIAPPEGTNSPWRRIAVHALVNDHEDVRVVFQVDGPHRGLDARPGVALPLRPVAPGEGEFSFISEVAPRDVARGPGPWTGMNGARMEARSAEGDTTFFFEVQDAMIDPLTPPMAVARLAEGLTGGSDAFLRVRALRDSDEPVPIRVDLVDVDGQRFSIVENLGRNPTLPPDAPVYLAYRDFHPWVFGRVVAGKWSLDPAKVREIQLRFFDQQGGGRVRVEIEITHGD